MTSRKLSSARAKMQCQGCRKRSPAKDVLFVTWPRWDKPRDATTGDPFYEGAWLCASCRQLDMIDYIERRIAASRDAALKVNDAGRRAGAARPWYSST